MPEFWTWWIQNGADDVRRLVEREVARDDRASSAGRPRPRRARSRRGSATASRRRRASARRPRPATRPSCIEPTRTSERACGLRRSVGHRRSACRCVSRCRATPTGTPRAARGAISLPQLAHVPYVPSSIRCERGVDLRRAPARSSPRACSRSRGRASRSRSRRDGCRSRRRSPRPRRRAMPGWSSRRLAIARSTRSRSSSSVVRKRSVSMLMRRRSFLPRSAADADARRRSTSAGPSPVSSTILSLAAVARNERERVARHRERLGEQAQHGVVRASVLGRRGDAHLPRVSVPADDLRAARAGADAQPHSCGRRRHAIQCTARV